ncbi:hypothetical protein GF358_01065 [Candidatus Woesearchaeota archaeon]|nr:hypothetical protein [Candidatus Woesearchaeota archaeon]
MKIYCLGNEDIELDSMALKIADKLNIPGVEFIKTDSLENIEGDIIIMDVIKGIKEVKLIRGLDQIKEFYPITAHDCDLGMELKLRKAINQIERVTIIGVPMKGNIEDISEQVKKNIKNIK